MAPAENSLVFCICCQRDVTVKQERKHRRRLLANPYPAALPSSNAGPLVDLTAVLDDDSSSDESGSEEDEEDDRMDVSGSGTQEDLPSDGDIDVDGLFDNTGFGNDEFGMDSDNHVEAEEPIQVPNYVPARARPFAATVEDATDSEDEYAAADDDEPEIPIEDSDVDDDDETIGVVDWEALEAELAALDMSGEDYEVQAAKIADKMDEFDRAICRAFAYKHKTHTADSAYAKLPFAFPSEPPLPGLAALRARVAFLSSYKPEFYDCCPNSCCCYAGPNADLDTCPFCKEGRYRPGTKKARKIFTYIPLIPRLIAFARNRRLAREMQHRHKYTSEESEEGLIRDILDGLRYQFLCKSNVKLDTKTYPHKYFSDPRDVALGLSTDGFAPFNRRKKTAWPLIVFNYNLPPDIWFHMEHILALGVIPGPKKPKDIDSFLWPFIQELFRLAQGVQALDILSESFFILRAYLIAVFGDIPAVSMVMKMKGHNGVSPCRMCEIKGVRIPGSRATTHYVPLDQSQFQVVQEDEDRIQKYDPKNLPLRTHTSLLAQAKDVDLATSGAAADELSKQCGIKGTPLLSYVPSLSFPVSFPYDFMHLIWENLVPNLILHWTGEFKGLDDGNETYQLSSAIWKAIGAGTAASGSFIPSAYGGRVPNIANDNTASTAETWSFWTLYIGPVLLRSRFKKPKYYRHFISLVQLLNICLQFEITNEEIEFVREGFVKWVEDYEKIYYQDDPSRVSACPLTIHALLHIADSIRDMGPVWCYWAFPMERYCGRLKPAIRSRRFPYAALDRYVLEDAQLSQITAFYDLADELSLKPPRDPSKTLKGSFKDEDSYPSCVLLPPRHKTPEVPTGILNSITAALATRFDRPVPEIRQHVKNASIEEWGKVRRVDSSEGDTMHTSTLSGSWEDRRDATFVRYEMLVDKHAARRGRRPVYEKQTFYGQLEHIYLIKFSPDCSNLALSPSKPIILAAIRSCKLEKPDANLEKLDIHLYTHHGSLDFIDIMSVQALVGRVKSETAGGAWAIIDRSGSLARAVFNDEDDG